MRFQNRKNEELRPILIEKNPNLYSEGSALIQMGHTKVLCTASVETQLPKWLSGKPQGWVTAEYSMLPRSTHTRISRQKALAGARSQEISRLIGRSLRATVDLKSLKGFQIIVDCDVIQADGGTRTASINGGFVALALALKKMNNDGKINHLPLNRYVCAVSVGIKNGETLLDLDYREDSCVDVDMNFVMTHENQFVELQGTAENKNFSSKQMACMTELAQNARHSLLEAQKKHIEDFFPLS